MSDATPGGPTPVDLFGIYDENSGNWLTALSGRSDTPLVFTTRERAASYAWSVIDLVRSPLIVAHISDPTRHRRTRVTAAGVKEIGGEDGGFDPKVKCRLGLSGWGKANSYVRE